MQKFEYHVVPAPKRGEKAKGVKTTEERFAYALTRLMNSLGAEGWDYVRADTLPCDERIGLTGTKTTFQNMLVFRRPLEEAAVADLPEAPELPIPAFGVQTDPTEPSALAATLGSAKSAVGQAPKLGPARTPGMAAE